MRICTCLGKTGLSTVYAPLAMDAQAVPWSSAAPRFFAPATPAVKTPCRRSLERSKRGTKKHELGFKCLAIVCHSDFTQMLHDARRLAEMFSWTIII